MHLLALECSSDRRSVAVASADHVLASSVHAEGRNTPIFALIDATLREAGVEKHDLARLAVGLGPGSYTGIRTALAVALGWDLARAVTVVGFSSADACAVVAARLGSRGPVSIVIDAQRGEFYLARYQLHAGHFIRLSPLRIATRDEVVLEPGLGYPLVGPALTLLGIEGPSAVPDASAIAELALRHGDSVRQPGLEPIYLRPHSFVKAPPSRVIPELPEGA